MARWYTFACMGEVNDTSLYMWRFWHTPGACGVQWQWMCKKPGMFDLPSGGLSIFGCHFAAIFPLHPHKFSLPKWNICNLYAARPKSYYELLEVSRNASAAEIHKAYKKKALQHHPDKNPGQVAEATELFKAIGEAYLVLRDPTKRAAYDYDLDNKSTWSALCRKRTVCITLMISEA